MKTARRLVTRLLPAAALGLPLSFASAEEVTVPTAEGGTWTMVIDPAARPHDLRPTRIAMQDGVPDPVDMPTIDAGAPPAPVESPAEKKAAEKKAAEKDAAEKKAAEKKAASEEAPTTEADEQDAASAASTPMPNVDPAPASPPPYFEMPITDSEVIPASGFMPAAPPASHAAPAMTIRPAGGSSADSPADAYRKIYASIPFNRAEYVANPSYRHDATMELLTGNPRLTSGYTGKTLELPKVTPYRPYLPSRNEYREVPFPYFGGAGFTGVGYGGIGNGGYSYTGPAALGLGNAGVNTGLNQFGLIGGYGFGGYGLGGGGLFGGGGFRGPGFGGRPVGQPTAPVVPPAPAPVH